MTSLAVIFILLLCVSHNQALGINTPQKVFMELQKELKDFSGVEVKRDKNDPLCLLIIVPEGLLQFKTDKADIPPKGDEFLQSFIPKLALTVDSPKFRNDINSIVVEGYTDSQGANKPGGIQYNWRLSQERSMAVVSESLLILEEGHFQGIHVNDFVKMLSASGRGDAKLIIDKKTGRENMAMSRRVIFKIRVRSIEQRLVKDITS